MPPTASARAEALGEQESKVLLGFCKHYHVEFRNLELLKLALTHRSYLSVTGQGPRESNERLEFLGDSVLGLVTSEFLYRQNPHEHEGQLTKTKSLLVSKAILSRRALAMGLGRFVLMSHSEVESGGRQRLSILADAFESVVGAIYLDQGFEASRAFIERWLLRDSREIAADKRHTNYKSHLQEYVQSAWRTHPVYRIRSEMGPDHSKQFMVEVMVGRRVLGSGKGQNKKDAEQEAARDALDRVQEGLARREGRREEPRRGEESRREIQEDPAREEPRREPRAEAPRRERPEDEPRRAEVRRPEERRPPEVRPADRRPEDRRPEERRMEPPAVPVAPSAVADTEPADETADAGAMPRRRRGRRGGRGRHRTEEEAGTAATPPQGGGAARPVHPRAEARASRELEPRPPAYEEDENEEVGRPEGPLEERHIDPYGFAAPAREMRRADSAPREVPPATAGRGPEPSSESVGSEPDSGPEEPPATGTEWSARQESPAAPAVPPVEPRAAEPRSGESRYGRKPGRGRRSR